MSDIQVQCDLLEKCGVGVGPNYRNSDSARTFISEIAKTLRHKFIINIHAANYFSILSDGSTDQSIVEQESIFIKFVGQTGVPETGFVDIVEIEHAHADGIYSAIVDGLANVNLNISAI